MECWIRLKQSTDLEFGKQSGVRGTVRGILCADYSDGGRLFIGLYESRPFFWFGYGSRGIIAESSLVKQPDSNLQDPWHFLGFSERAHLAFVYEKEKSEMKIYINGKLNCAGFSEPLMHNICYLQVFLIIAVLSLIFIFI